MKDYLFAYGTLVPELAPATMTDDLRALKGIGRAFIPGRLYDLGDFPGAVFDANATHLVWGQVFEIPSETAFLAKLDAYEEWDPEQPESSLFRRERHTATLPSGMATPHSIGCWVYAYNRNPEGATFLPEGDYAEFRTMKCVVTPHRG